MASAVPDGAATARRIAAAVRALPDVAGLSAGPFGTVATPDLGGRVEGVAVRADTVEIAVVARWGRPLPGIADDVRAAAAGLLPEGVGVHVDVADVATGTE
ncbi:hypothetical protein [Nocardiopsis trehalosi]|uniref:hypothetical protein n=1 Tax=Nocardiopsis trehalosi TaxID=109329 RepID=UPI00082B2C06|nr:hypothetical protein [Nocardiopsis trehalosi]